MQPCHALSPKSSVQLLSRVRLFVTPWTATWSASLSITNSWSLLKLRSIQLVMPSNHLILCDPLLLLPSVFPSKRVFSMSQFSASGSQSTGVSASASVLPMNTQNWFPLGWNGWISLQAKSLPSHVLLFAIHWLLPTRLLRPWNFPGKSTGVGCHFLLQGIFLTQVSNPCPLSRWCHPTISSSVVPFSSCLQYFPASGSFSVSQFFTSGGQSIGVSASASVLLKNIQDWFALGLTGWISLQSKGLSRVFSNTTVQKHQFFGAQLSLWSNSHIYRRLLEKP